MKQWFVIDISMRAIFKILGVILGLWFLYAIRDIVLLFFIVIVLVVALAPVVEKLQEHMPRGLAVGLVFIVLLALFSLIVGLLIPPVIGQVTELTHNLPFYSQRIEQLINQLQIETIDQSSAQEIVQQLSRALSTISTSLVQVTINLLGGLVNVFTVLVLGFYLLLEERGIRKMFLAFLPVEHKVDIINALNKVGVKLGAWLRGQLLLMVIIGLVTGIWTSALGLPYALTLALWAGLTEVIPYVGPIIGGIPILIIAFLDSPIKAIIAIVLLAITQQVESNFIVPKVMQRSVGLSPVIVILALLIGGKLFGIAGTILSVPVAATIAVVIEEWPKIMKAMKA